MALFVVTYDLNKQKEYPKLWAAFDALGAHKCVRSVYFVKAANTASEVLAHFRKFIDEDDQLIVVEFSKLPATYRANEGTAAWLKANMP